MTRAIVEGLDRAGKLDVGRGMLEMRGAARIGTGGGRAGIELEYEHRATRDLSLFAEGWAGLAWANGQRELAAEALAGMRWVF